MTTSKSSRIIATARPNFLLLTPCCLSLAVAFAIADHLPIDSVLLALILLGALAAHASVNMLNEYQDFLSGLDINTKRTAFNGGSGTLPAKPELAESVKFTGIACLLVTILIGFYFLAMHGWRLAPLGLAGILLVCFYTDRITRWPWLCLLAPRTGLRTIDDQRRPFRTARALQYGSGAVLIDCVFPGQRPAAQPIPGS